jgi:tRNA 5-methylaminomethyl-2-thiouridine biosynthesis bifunctional protein
MKQAKISWHEGQPQNDEFEDVYFSTAGGIAETQYVFLQQNKCPECWQGKSDFVIAETGFGTGLNFLATVKLWLETANPSSKLHFISVEKYPLSKQNLQQALSVWPELKELRSELIAAYPSSTSGYHQRWLFDDRVSLLLLQGDVVDMLSQLNARVDIWFLDGFAPDKNPDMWSDKVFEQMARLSQKGSRFSTYTVAGFVRRGLQAAGFEIEKVKGFGKKREMLTGVIGQDVGSSHLLPWFHLTEFKPESKRVAVIGAGIAGVTTASALARQGWQVELIDKHESIAGGASGNPLGVVLPRPGLDDSPETGFYNQAYFKAIFELNNLTRKHEHFNWQQAGVIQLPSSARIKKQIDNILRINDLAQVMDAEKASELSGLNIEQDVLFYPEAGYVSPEKLCQSLLDVASKNINCHFNSEIKELKQLNNKWSLIDKNNHLVCEVDAVVLANAEAVNQFKQTAWIDVQSVRGQISYLPSNDSKQTIKIPVCYEGYILPEHDAHHIVGATFSPDDCLVDVRKKDHEKNIEDINNWFHGLFEIDETDIKGRASIRAASKDRMPIVGPVANKRFYQQFYHDLGKGKSAHKYPNAEYLSGLYVNTAHGSRGLTSSFIAAELIVAQLGNQPVTVPEKLVNALHPSRFLIRSFKKSKL